VAENDLGQTGDISPTSPFTVRVDYFRVARDPLAICAECESSKVSEREFWTSSQNDCRASSKVPLPGKNSQCNEGALLGVLLATTDSSIIRLGFSTVILW